MMFGVFLYSITICYNNLWQEINFITFITMQLKKKDILCGYWLSSSMTSVFKLLPQQYCLVISLKKCLDKTCTNPQVCPICSLSHKHALIVRVPLKSLPSSSPRTCRLNYKHAALHSVVLLSNYNAQTVEGERCWSPLHSLAAAILSGYFSVGIWQTRDPSSHTSEISDSLSGTILFHSHTRTQVWNTSRTTAFHTDHLDTCRTLFKDRSIFSLTPYSELPSS